jgi:putative phage-type endonuclease
MNKARDIKWYRNRVKVLRAKPQEIQRSPSWFKARNTRVTASEASCLLTLSEEHCKVYVEDFNVKKFKYKPDHCMSHYDNREDYIINKCRTFYGENLFKDSIYTLHGKKFEEIATRLYRKRFNTDVIEFGLLPHPRLSYIAASPDGITSSGIMLEIKCPYSRKIIEGVPPIWYWCQMQVQLEVADLDQCDFLECEIKEVSYEEYLQIVPETNQDTGILLNRVAEPDNSETKYIYPPDSLDTNEEFINWSQNTIYEFQQQNIEVVPIFYFIHKWFVLNVYRRKEWFNSVKHHFKENMDIIKKLQSDKNLFDNYWNNIKLIRNKAYNEKYNNTSCLIDIDQDNEEFVIHNNIDVDVDVDMDVDIVDTGVITTCLITDD